MEENKLTEFRKQIDAIDKQIVELLGKRMEFVKEVGKYKKENNILPLDASRWEAVLQSKMQLANEIGLDEQVIKDIYNRIHEYALQMEDEV